MSHLFTGSIKQLPNGNRMIFLQNNNSVSFLACSFLVNDENAAGIASALRHTAALADRLRLKFAQLTLTDAGFTGNLSMAPADALELEALVVAAFPQASASNAPAPVPLPNMPRETLH